MMRSGFSHFSEATKADPGADSANIAPSIQSRADSLHDVGAESLNIPFMRLTIRGNAGDRLCLYALVVDNHIVPALTSDNAECDGKEFPIFF
jgi:hypothetical protein